MVKGKNLKRIKKLIESLVGYEKKKSDKKILQAVGKKWHIKGKQWSVYAKGRKKKVW